MPARLDERRRGRGSSIYALVGALRLENHFLKFARIEPKIVLWAGPPGPFYAGGGGFIDSVGQTFIPSSSAARRPFCVRFRQKTRR